MKLTEADRKIEKFFHPAFDNLETGLSSRQLDFDAPRERG